METWTGWHYEASAVVPFPSAGNAEYEPDPKMRAGGSIWLDKRVGRVGDSGAPLEAVEKVECLRYLENGVSMKMVVTSYMGVEIDTPDDLERAAKLL